MDDNLNLSFIKISKNLNLGQLKKILLEPSLRELKIKSSWHSFLDDNENIHTIAVWKYICIIVAYLTLIGMRGDTFHSLSISDRILSAEFYKKFPTFLDVKLG